MSDGKGGACAQARRTERRGPGLILSANVDEEAISGPCNQCVSIRCMSSAALGSAAICGVEFGGGHLDYMWPLNYFEQQHCLLSQEVCTLGTTPKKVSIDPRFTPASSEVQQRKHEAEQDNWFCKPENTELRKEETYNCRGLHTCASRPRVSARKKMIAPL